MRRLLKLSSLPVTLLAGILSCILSFNAHAQGQVFDHAETGFDLVGGHSVLPCQSCHVGGQFEGTPRNCVGCHTNNGPFNATFKPVNHIMTTEQCEACHRPTLWEDMPRVDHDNVFGSCNSCHNNVIVSGKPIDHIPAPDDCSECHSTLSFVPANFSHNNLVASCESCHNGTAATGKPADHPPTTNQCELCHNTFAFTPLQSFDHGAAIGPCAGCHNDFNDFATGKPADHILITQDRCESCHIDQSVWLNYSMDHDYVSDDCLSCHYKNSPYTGQFDGHRETGMTQCSVCHTDRTTFSVHIDL